MTTHLQRWQQAAGLVPDDDFGPKSEERGMQLLESERELLAIRLAQKEGFHPGDSDEITSPTGYVSPGSSLQLMRLSWFLREWARSNGNPIEPARVSEYLMGCIREGKPTFGPWLAQENLKNPQAFCAATIGYAEHHCGFAEHPLPPWRSGALKIRDDAKAGLRPNERWAPLWEFWDGTFIKCPPKGSVAIHQNRKDPGAGHAELFIEGSERGIRCIGANEQHRRIRVDVDPLPWNGLVSADASQILMLSGFVVPV